jgi:hypothetical protein
MFAVDGGATWYPTTFRLQLYTASGARPVAVVIQTCTCRKPHPRSSADMFVLMEDAAEALVSSYVQLRDLVSISDRRRQWMQRAGIRDALMRPVAVIEIPNSRTAWSR